MRGKRAIKEAERFSVAIHEAAHWVFAEWLGISNVLQVTIVPSAHYLGQFRPRVMPTHPPFSRRLVLMTLAGRAGENAILGRRSWVDGTDFIQAYDIAGKHLGPDAVQILFRRAERLCAGPLWAAITTTAALLMEVETMHSDELYDLWEVINPRRRARPAMLYTPKYLSGVIDT